MASGETRIYVIVQQGHTRLAEMVTNVSDGRHEFVFSQPMKVNGRHFEGFALECWLDKEARHVAYHEHIAKRPPLVR